MNMRPQTSTNNTGGLAVFHHSFGSCCHDNPLEYTNNYTSERQEFSVDIPPSVRKVLLRPQIDATASGHPHLTRSNCSFVPRLSRNVNCIGKAFQNLLLYDVLNKQPSVFCKVACQEILRIGTFYTLKSIFLHLNR